MPDEHESAIAAWLDLPTTKREIAIVAERHPDWSSYEVHQFVLSMEMLVALEVYGQEPDIELPPPEPGEPWRG